jgi:hypothetical protein
VQLLDLLLGHLHLFERGGDVVKRQKAPLLTIRDERTQLVQLVDRSFVRQQNIVIDSSAPLWCRCPSLACVACPSSVSHRTKGL